MKLTSHSNINLLQATLNYINDQFTMLNHYPAHIEKDAIYIKDSHKQYTKTIDDIHRCISDFRAGYNAATKQINK